MSDAVFPDLPGRSPDSTRTAIYKTKIAESPSGREDRTSWASGARYQYELKYNFLREGVVAPAPWNGYSEAQVVQRFASDHLGRFDSFTFTDIVTGAQVRVRFVEDSFKMTRIAAGIWTASFSLITVI